MFQRCIHLAHPRDKYLGVGGFFWDKSGSSAVTHFPVLLQMQEMFRSLPVHVSCSLATSIIHPARPPGVIPGPKVSLFLSKVSSGISALAVLCADE